MKPSELPGLVCCANTPTKNSARTTNRTTVPCLDILEICVKLVPLFNSQVIDTYSQATEMCTESGITCNGDLVLWVVSVILLILFVNFYII